MRTLSQAFATFVLAAALIAANGVSTAPALQKEKDKKVKEVGTVEVYQAKDGWRFRVKNAEGKSVAIGTVGYDKKEECLEAVEFVKTTLGKAKVTEIKEDKK
jgi:uncharacterized protein YegP (UPF0339 family)